MSAKWRRVKAWDQEHLTGPLTPVRWVLTAFSSITLAVTLLTTVAAYGALASIPIGLWAMIPTKVFQLVTLLAVVLALLAGTQWLLGRAIRGRLSREWVFALRFIAGLAIILAGWRLWLWGVWPLIRYEPAVAALNKPATGVRFFADFVDQYRGTLLRQLPSWEMTEIEFYSWWPFKLVLILFVMNMVTATVRRIEFIFVNIGVLTVHTGIVLISLGSIFYERGKVEGDIRLVRNSPPKSVYYDAIVPALYAWKEGDGRLYVHPLRGLARYNDAPAGTPYAPNAALHAQPQFGEIFPPSLEISVVGVIPYGVREPSWVDGGSESNPSINVKLDLTAPDGRRLDWQQRLIGGMAQDRASGAAHLPGLTLEHLVAPAPQRLADLARAFPAQGDHAIIVRVPASGFEEAFVVEPGAKVAVGATGWTVGVDDTQAAEEGLALVSTGYRGASSSRINLTITSPEGQTFNRSVLHQYPELTQDFIPGEAGRPPQRVAPNPAIDIVYLDASSTYLWVVQDDPAAGRFRVVQRVPGGEVKEFEVNAGDSIVGELEGATMRFTFDGFWPRTTRRFDVHPVPAEEQDRSARGTYFHAYLDVETRVKRADGTTDIRRRWLPFNQYLDADYEFQRLERFDLPEVGTITLAFGRLRRTLPGIALALNEFAMIPYAGTDTPRDYASTVRVFRGPEDREGEEHVTRLNRPYIYRRPFVWSDGRHAVANSLAWLGSIIVPEQYKFSQAGWDPVNQRFTVLGVGNNPGIYIIALGGILMGAGIPWAFYVKPAIMQRRKRLIKEQLERGEYTPPARRSADRPAELMGANA